VIGMIHIVNLDQVPLACVNPRVSDVNFDRQDSPALGLIE
jgi:hypothetical protein